MTTMNEDLQATLNELIKVCKDEAAFFRDAAERIDERELQASVRKWSQERGRFASQLEGEVRRLGGTPRDAGSVQGAVRRAWVNVKSSVSNEEEELFLTESRRLETNARDKYQEALTQTLPADLLRCVEQQYEAIEGTHARLRSLRNKYGQEQTL